ncbi:MAG: hypothetical protein WBH71_05255 [Bacteroidales bacterium]|nr:hypothetical protein [Bacteroidales bacterium]HOR77048.1 hypothetical protein [Bacteroidales bacterium]HPL12438.1 hypothetical protein [Bacteroidales bacterium]
MTITAIKPKGCISIDLLMLPCKTILTDRPSPQPGHDSTPRLLNGHKV